MTQMTDDLSEYYDIGKEIVAFSSTSNLIKKIQYYVDHEAERKQIAALGYERTIRDHTYEKRFAQIFEAMGLGSKLKN